MQFNFEPAKENDPLKSFGRNLTKEAKRNKLDPIIGRDDEIRRLIRILSRKTKNNPILIGEPGVGKTAIVEGLAQRIVNNQVPDNLRNKEIYEIDLPSMIAGASFQGQFEKRLKSLMKKIKESSGQIIVFIDEFHTLIGTGKNAQGGMDAAQIIKPMLSRGEMHLIGATTLIEHKKYIESDPALERRMQKIMVDEPTEIESITILRGLKVSLENYHHVKISDEAIVTAVKLSSRYIFDRFLPDKAIDLIDEAAARIKTEINSKPEELEKSLEKIATLSMEKAALDGEKNSSSNKRLIKIIQELEQHEKHSNKLKRKWELEKQSISELSKIKEEIEELRAKQQRFQLDGDYAKASEILYQKLPLLEKKLQSKNEELLKSGNPLIKDTVTDDEVCQIISQWTKIPVDKLLKPQKEQILKLNKILSKNVIGQNNAIEKIYNTILRSKAGINDPNAPIGSFIFMGPTGVGKTEIAKTLANVLFNSEKEMIRMDMSEYMEKHSISRLIGSPPGYVGYEQGGQLTEAVRRKPYSIILLDEIEKAHHDVLNILLQILDDGRLTDSQGRLINFKNTIIIMTTNIASNQIMSNPKDTNKIKEELFKYLLPEFLNRVDDIVVFNSLTIKEVEKISALELNKFNQRLIEQNIYIDFDKNVSLYIAKKSYNPTFGARPIKRYIKDNIETIIAEKIISDEINKNKSYSAFFNGGKLLMSQKKLN